MRKTADYTIQGFLYQFNKTLLEILNSDSDAVIVEGIIEDIEIHASHGLKAIQCKYHEAQESFVLSKLYEPLLQMMTHFVSYRGVNVNYLLYAYFPEKSTGDTFELTEDHLDEIISSKNIKYKKYMSSLQDNFNRAEFKSSVTIEFGRPINELVQDVHCALVSAGISKDDVELIAYPNAINDIANIACKHDAAERSVRKADFVERLHAIKTTAISRWTLALNTRRKLMDARKKQLKAHLGINSRTRYFIICDECVDDFESSVVILISDYIEKYHFKPTHIKTPLFCLDCPTELFRSIRLRLHKKGINISDGFVGDYFDEDMFFRRPMVQDASKQFIKREFDIRLLEYNSKSSLMNERKADDIFIVSNRNYDGINRQDVNIEHLAVTNLMEAGYLIGIRDDC